MGAKHVKYKNYYLKTSFKFNFLKIVFYCFENKNKNHPTNQALGIWNFNLSILNSIVFDRVSVDDK